MKYLNRFHKAIFFYFALHINVRETEGAIKNGQSRETDNIGYTRRRQAQKTKTKKQKQHTHNTICDGHHYTQTNTHNVNKRWALLQTTEVNSYFVLDNISRNQRDRQCYLIEPC